MSASTIACAASVLIVAFSGAAAAAPTNRTSDTGKIQRWRQPEIVVSIDESVEHVGADARSSVEKAFAAWTGVPLPALRFERAQGAKLSMKPDGLNAVIVARIDLSGHRNDVAFTVSHTDSQTGEILEADIVLNAKYLMATLGADAEDLALAELEHRTGRADVPDDVSVASALPSVADACDGNYDLQNTVTHEVGHFWGLGEDRDVASATMYYRLAPCETHKRTPEESDTAALAKAYEGGVDDPGEVNCSLSSPRTTDHSRRSSIGMIMAACAAILGRRLRKGAPEPKETGGNRWQSR